MRRDPDHPAPDWAGRVLDAALDAIITIDAADRVVHANRAAERLFGFAADAVLGRSLADLIMPPDFRAAHRAGLARLLDGGPPVILDRRVELRAMRADGTQFPVELTVTRTSDTPPRFTGFVRDLTELHDAERQLQAHDAVVRALRDWGSVEEGTVDLLRRVGEALGCPVGMLWVWSEAAGGLVCRAFWRQTEIDAGDAEVLARRAVLLSGQGPPGRAWRDGAPAAGGPFSRFGRDALARTGLHPYVGIPATTPDGPVAVLSYYGFDDEAPGAALLATLAGIGAQLGRFLAARRAQLEPQQVLSPRETEVLRLAAEGNTGPEIAALLVLSPATVKTHFENIYEKFGVGDRAAAVAHAFRIGLIH